MKFLFIMVLTMSGKLLLLLLQQITGVVRGLVTGVGNTTLRLVMTDSSLVDIDDQYPECFRSNRYQHQDYQALSF